MSNPLNSSPETDLRFGGQPPADAKPMKMYDTARPPPNWLVRKLSPAAARITVAKSMPSEVAWSEGSRRRDVPIVSIRKPCTDDHLRARARPRVTSVHSHLVMLCTKFTQRLRRRRWNGRPNRKERHRFPAARESRVGRHRWVVLRTHAAHLIFSI